MTLTPEQEVEFESIVSQAEYAEVKQMLTVWEERGIEKGIQQGAVTSMRRTILRQMTARFGAIPPKVVARVEGIESQSELEKLLDLVLTASTLEAMGLN